MITGLYNSIKDAELTAYRIWTDNWKRMLPSIVTTHGLVPPSLINVVERFAVTAQRLLNVQREFSGGDPVLVRTALPGLKCDR